MLIKSMALLNRYYSANDNLFKRAVQAQVLITSQSVEVYKQVLAILPTLQVGRTTPVYENILFREI